MHPNLTIALATEIQREMRTNAPRFPRSRTTRRQRPRETRTAGSR